MAKRKADYQFSNLSRSSKWRKTHNSQNWTNETIDEQSNYSSEEILPKNISGRENPSNRSTEPEEILSNDISSIVAPNNPIMESEVTQPNSISNLDTSSDSEEDNSVHGSGASQNDSENSIIQSDDENQSVDLDINSNNESTFYSKSTANSKESESPVQSFLHTWAVKSNVPLKTLDSLLSGLKQLDPAFENLPKTGRALVRTPKEIFKRTVEPGNYLHLGIKYQLLSMISKIHFDFDSINLLINIDGLPPFKSSQGEFIQF